MRWNRLAVLPGALLVAITLSTAPAASAAPPASASSDAAATCTLPESNAEALEILNYDYPNKYVWDHTDLTVAIQAAPNVSREQLDAIHEAIATWDSVLRDCFDGVITLTDVTGEKRRTADIVVHYVPRAGGVVFGGYAICGARGCPNIIVRSDLPPSRGYPPYSPEYLNYTTQHELGHALGLGHTTNLYDSTGLVDVMGYGWDLVNEIDPVLSQCDVDTLAYLFSWALDGTTPPAPGPSTLERTFDCSTT